MYQEIHTLYPLLLLRQPSNFALLYLCFINSSGFEWTVVKITHNTYYDKYKKHKSI